MDKIKELWGKYKTMAIIAAIVLIAAVTGVVIYLSIKPAPPPPVNDLIPTGTQESSEPPEPVSEFVVPDIPSAPPSSAPASSASSSSVASKEPDIKVTGNISSKAAPKPTSSKPSKGEGNVSSKPASPPASPASSSEQTPPPTSSEPPSVTEPVDPPYNPDGPQHGDTKTNSDGSTWYFHVGANGYESKPMWDLWGKFPQAKRVDGKFDGSFLEEGETIWVEFKNSNARWCKIQNSWVAETAYNLNTHTGNDHKPKN